MEQEDNFMSKTIDLTYTGDYKETRNFLKDFIDNYRTKSLLDSYGRKIVTALQKGTPKRTGETASSWYYTVTEEGSVISLEIKNDHMGSDGKTPVAILIQMGHGTRTGGYVPPTDYINPAVEPLFKELSDKLTSRR